jgi:lipid II:glycine glycyltransferase (peptidoglycan interpeptide bridge formation enzyme)
MINRDEYVEKLKAQLDQWNADIAKWEAKAREAQVETRAEFDKKLEALRQQCEQAMYQMNLLQSAAGDAWTDFVRGADEAWARMREAFDQASSHFRPK